MTSYKNYYELLIYTLKQNNISIKFDDFDCFEAIEGRKNGKVFSNEEHLRGIIFSLLSSQRPWGPILQNKKNICEIFHNFDLDYIANTDPSLFEDSIRSIKCGNKSIHRQMSSLPQIVAKLKDISNQFSSADMFVNSDKPIIIAKKMSTNGKFKIPELGLALALEYLRNVGINVAKPDTQLCRLFGRDRLGLSSKTPAKPEEVVEIIDNIATETNMSPAKLGTMFWLICAKDYGHICSSNTPSCLLCMFQSVCNYYREKVYI